MAEVLDKTMFDEVDVFGLFDSAAGHDLDIDPYPYLADMRRQGPVLPVDFHDVIGVDKTVMVTAQSSGYITLDAPIFSAVSFDAVDRVMRDAKSFSQEIQRRSYEHSFGVDSIEALDAPEHRIHRSLVERAFTRRALDGWVTDMIIPLAHRRSEQLLARGPEADLVADFTFTYPAEIITSLLGLPDDDIPRFMRIAITMGNPAANIEMAQQGSRLMSEWIASILEERRSRPGGGDLVSLLLEAEIDGEKLSDEIIITFVRFLFPAGFETTYRTLSNLMVALLSTGQWDLLKKDRSLVPHAVEEGLRWQTSVIGHPRLAVRDVDLCGVPVPEGSVVQAFHGSANRDETRWDHAEEFDISRPLLPNATFGFGPHLCLGKYLARAESIAAVNAFLDTFPDVRISPDATEEDYRIRGIYLRSPHRLPVTLA